jgi:hypothetical protein
MNEAGERHWGKPGEWGTGQLCLTNPDVVKLVAERVMEYFRENPTASFISLSPNDWGGWCRCNECLKLYPSPEEARKDRSLDGELFDVSDALCQFLNAVAELVYPAFPDKKLYCYAYCEYVHPPVHCSPHPMVMPSLCHMNPANYARPLNDPEDEHNRGFVDIIQGWRKTGVDLFYYAYTCKSMWEQNPWPIVRNLAQDIRYLRDQGFYGFYSQGGENYWGQLGANYYVMAKLLWNPDQDVEPLLADYFTHAYGPAAEPMKRCFDALEAAFTKKGNYIHHEAPEQTQQILTPEVVATCDAALPEAYAATTDPIFHQRIEIVDLSYRYAQRCRAAWDAYHAWLESEERDDLARAVEEMEEALRLREAGAEIDTLIGPTSPRNESTYHEIPGTGLGYHMYEQFRNRYYCRWQAKLSERT